VTRNSAYPGIMWLILLSKHQMIYQVVQNAMGRAHDLCGGISPLQNVVGKSEEREHLAIVVFYRIMTLKFLLKKYVWKNMADFCVTAMNIRIYCKTKEILTFRELLCIVEKS